MLRVTSVELYVSISNLPKEKIRFEIDGNGLNNSTFIDEFEKLVYFFIQRSRKVNCRIIFRWISRKKLKKKSK